MRLNETAVNKAKKLIKNHQYVLESEWSEAQASGEDENKFLKHHDWDEYGQWFLAIDTQTSAETKDRFKFPFGDFRRLHRSGLIAAKQRAAQYGYNNIQKVADDLLQLLEETRAD